MALTGTLDTVDLAQWLGGIDISDPAIVRLLGHLLASATDTVAGYAPDAPVNPRNQAILRVAGTLWYFRAGGLPDSPRGDANLLVMSGARSILHRHRRIGVTA